MSQDRFTPRDEALIDIDSDEEIRGWANVLGVENVAVIDAVNKVGPKVDDVRHHLDQAMAAGQQDA
jgi:hypothetical protein